MSADTIVSLSRQVIAGKPLSREQAETLVAAAQENHHELLNAAARIREHFRGRQVGCCSIVASKVGRCAQNCAFCSQSAHHTTHVPGAGSMDPEDVFQAAMDASDNGAQCIGLVNSGFGPTDDEIDYWGPTVKRIRATDRIGVCASLGVVSEQQAQRLADFGVQRYNLNLQTSRRHFPKIITTHSFDDRLQSLYHLKSAGIQLCCGALFGMGEDWDDRLDLAFELRQLGVDVVPINFLIPIKGTPLADLQPLEPMDCLKILAVFRFLLPETEIKAAGGRESNLRDLQSWIFHAGADGILIGNYLTTLGRSPQEDHQMLKDLGLTLRCDHLDRIAGKPERAAAGSNPVNGG